MKTKDNLQSDDAKARKDSEEDGSFWRGDAFKGARMAFLIAFAILVLGIVVSLIINTCIPSCEIGMSIVRDINVLLISTSATLLGLYVTAFIFLNDSLKTRIKEDQTIKEAVKKILSRYRINMWCIALGTILTIVLEVLCNILLGIPGSEVSIENLRLPLNSGVWYLFVIVTVCSVFIIVWIILASKDITNSDYLITKQSWNNLNFHQRKLEKYYDDAVGNIDSAVVEPQSAWTDFTAMSGFEILDEFGNKEYTFLLAYYNLGGKTKKIIETKSKQQIDGNDYDEYIIELGKTVRLIESIVARICDNNIDKSIMNNELIFQSMRSGFLWLYARDTADSVLDVRDANRFLDHLKYQIITDKRFERRPFDNQEVEEAFSRARQAFFMLEHEDRKKYIKKYKANTRRIIEKFFDGYEHLIGYRDALVHYDEYSKKQSSHKHMTISKNVQKECEQILVYAEILKRVLIDRFTSFVKTNDLNLGNSTMSKGWFNYSEFTDSNFTHSSFKFARLESAIFRRCDLSTCNFILADASDTDFTASNFSYSDMTGMDLTDCVLYQAQMNSVLLRDGRIDDYRGLMDLMNNGVDKTKYVSEIARQQEWYCRIKNVSNIGKSMDSESERKYQIVRDNLRNGEAMKELVKIFADGGRSSAPALFRDCYAIPADDYTAAILVDVKSSILDRPYQAITEYLKEFVDYRKYSKISDKIYDVIPQARVKELVVSGDKVNNDKKDAREKHYGKIYFGTAILRSASVNEVSMKDIDFSHVHIDTASFRDSDLSGAEMYYTSACDAMFFRTNLNGTDAYKANFGGCNFNEASIIHAVFTDCNFSNSNLSKALLLNSIFYYTDEEEKMQYRKPYLSRYLRRITHNHSAVQELLEYVEDEEFILSEKGDPVCVENEPKKYALRHITQLSSSYKCLDMDLTEAIANFIVIVNANMMRSNLSRISAKNGFLFNVLLRWCEVAEASFSNGIFYGVSFHQTNLSSSVFSRARIFGCEMSNVNISGAKFISALIQKTLYEEANLSHCNLSNATVENCSFKNCNFNGVIVNNTTFKRVIFSRTDFSSAIGLSDAVFIDCVFEKNLTDGAVTDPEIVLSKSDEEEVRVVRTNSGDMMHPPLYSSDGYLSSVD